MGTRTHLLFHRLLRPQIALSVALDSCCLDPEFVDLSFSIGEQPSGRVYALKAAVMKTLLVTAPPQEVRLYRLRSAADKTQGEALSLATDGDVQKLIDTPFVLVHVLGREVRGYSFSLDGPSIL